MSISCLVQRKRNLPQVREPTPMRALLSSLLLLLLFLPSLADAKGEAVQASKAFDQAGIKAQSVKDLYPLVTATSVKMLSGLSAADQAKWLGLLQTMTKLEAAEGYFPLVDSKIKDNHATLTFKREKQEKNSKQSLIKEVLLVREGGTWKVDVSGYKLP